MLHAYSKPPRRLLSSPTRRLLHDKCVWGYQAPREFSLPDFTPHELTNRARNASLLRLVESYRVTISLRCFEGPTDSLTTSDMGIVQLASTLSISLTGQTSPPSILEDMDSNLRLNMSGKTLSPRFCRSRWQTTRASSTRRGSSIFRTTRLTAKLGRWKRSLTD